jgi:2-methylisocitrate lyase-like PEP mutase family enzyme
VTKPKSLKELISSGKLTIAPGAYDCITARLIEQAGYPAVYMTGAGTSAAHGLPDYGLLTMTEMVANARRITGCINVPLIADSDTGYGNELNAYRTVQEYERAGVAGIHIEDQVFPKKCGHLDDKEMVSLDDYLAKIRAAVAARRSSGFIIIARTDSRARLGFEEAIMRANAAIEAGADMAFVEAPQTLAEVEAVPKQVKGHCLLNVVTGGKTPQADFADVERMGYALAILPSMLIRNIIETCDELLAQTQRSGRAADLKLQPESAAQRGPASTFARFDSAAWDRRRTEFRVAVKPKRADRSAAE